jgi:hypothetical protein
LRKCGNVKKMSKELWRTLTTLKLLNNAFTLIIHGNVKTKLKDYQEALENLGKVHVF